MQENEQRERRIEVRAKERSRGGRVAGRHGKMECQQIHAGRLRSRAQKANQNELLKPERID
jgi:hypothetical protein